MRNRVKNIHFVGVGGSGMSGIAEVLVNLNYTVSGSDIADGPVPARLRKAGIRVVIGHHVDCLLYTSPSPRDQRGSRMPSSA